MSYGVSGRALVAELGKGVAANITSIAARFTSPVFPGVDVEHADLANRNRARRCIEPRSPGSDGASNDAARVVLDDGEVEYAEG